MLRSLTTTGVFAVVLAGSAGLGGPAGTTGPAPGGGRIPALAWEPRSDWVDVRRFGAVGDGHADDTAAIQRAFDRAGNGTTLYLPAGTYRLTQTLSLSGEKRLTGVLVVGHGRDTTLFWDGEEGGKVLRDDGVAYSRFVGFAVDGRGKAAVGFWHDSHKGFETEVRHQHLAFRGFTDAAVLAEPKDRFALAETTFENCLFENCRRAVVFVQFNDYNYTFDGCEFRACGTGIECAHGNFYVRNCRFEGSRDVDILARPEHGCSVRRCVSVGSNAFVRFANSVSPFTIQDCHVAKWRDERGAVVLSGAPALLFDCTFSSGPPGSAPVRLSSRDQPLILSANRVAPGALLVQPAEARRVRTIPCDRPKGSSLPEGRRFLRSSVQVPGTVFDAKRDFGAAGDGKADDTAAIQKTIDAARAHGDGAIAYLPSGFYRISETLRITGSRFTVGSSGFYSRLIWHGPQGGTMVEVSEPRGVTLEHLAIGHGDSPGKPSGIDVLQTGGGQPSLMTYDGVFVFGLYKEQPFRQGLHFRNLTADDVVLMPHVQGNLRIVDSARATILGTCTYEGAIVVEGRSPGRDGLLGFLTRLTTHNTFGVFLRDNHGIVMSDYYIEQADNGFCFSGGTGLPPGRATISCPKLHFTVNKAPAGKGTAVHLNEYTGPVCFLATQSYIEPGTPRIEREADTKTDLVLAASVFYQTRPELRPVDAVDLHLLACVSRGKVTPASVAEGPFSAKDAASERTAALVAAALDDLRRLGEADLRLNHPEAPPAPRPAAGRR